MKKQNNRQVTKDDLIRMKAYQKFEEVVANAEKNARTDTKRGNAKDISDFTIHDKDEYTLYSTFLRRKEVYGDIFTEEQWDKMEASVMLYEMNGCQTVKVDNEDYSVIDSLVNESEIAEIAKKLGKR